MTSVAGTSKLRVAFVDLVLEPDKPGRSGLSDIVWDMASELTNQGHEVHVISSYHVHAYPDPRVLVHSFTTPPMGYRNVLGLAWMVRRAARAIKVVKPDVVHAPEYMSTALLDFFGVTQPLVLTVPGNIFHRLEHGNAYEWYFTQILKWAAKRSARSCARVIAISSDMKRWWEWTGSPPDRTPWIPLGIDTTRFRRVPAARERLGIPDDIPVFLYLGRFSREKGLTDLLEAVVRVKGSLEAASARVALVGQGPLEHELRLQISRQGLGSLVQLEPWANQEVTPLWYSAASALVLPSWSEGFSRTVPEAMICGTPVIGTRISGTEDHVQDGVTGVLVPPRDAHALAHALQAATSDVGRLAAMGERAKRYAELNLTWGQAVRRIIEEVYVPAAKDSGRTRGRISAAVGSFRGRA